MADDDKKALLRLADFLVEDVMATSDAELMAEELEDAADDLWLAAAYIKETLDAGREVYESKWLGPVVEAHRLLEQAAKAFSTHAKSVPVVHKTAET